MKTVIRSTVFIHVIVACMSLWSHMLLPASWVNQGDWSPLKSRQFYVVLWLQRIPETFFIVLQQKRKQCSKNLNAFCILLSPHMNVYLYFPEAKRCLTLKEIKWLSIYTNPTFISLGQMVTRFTETRMYSHSSHYFLSKELYMPLCVISVFIVTDLLLLRIYKYVWNVLSLFFKLWTPIQINRSRLWSLVIVRHWKESWRENV